MPVPDPHPTEVLEVLHRKGPQTRIAVAGASNDPAKYGNIIVRNLKGKGYTVLPVNPKESLIEGLPVAHTIGEIEKPVDILVVVTPPPVTLRVLREGSFDDAVLEFAATAPFKVVHHACVMVASNF
jgi:predicted CoA-binding protein